LKIAEKDTRKLARENSPWGPALAILLRALLTHLRGGDGTAKLLEAEEALQKLDMQLHARVVRRQRGILTGDKLLVEDADAWLRGQEVKEPSLLAAMLAPLGNISAPPA
jgi:hypothetical protein